MCWREYCIYGRSRRYFFYIYKNIYLIHIFLYNHTHYRPCIHSTMCGQALQRSDESAQHHRHSNAVVAATRSGLVSHVLYRRHHLFALGRQCWQLRTHVCRTLVEYCVCQLCFLLFLKLYLFFFYSFIRRRISAPVFCQRAQHCPQQRQHRRLRPCRLMHRATPNARLSRRVLAASTTCVSVLHRMLATLLLVAHNVLLLNVMVI